MPPASRSVNLGHLTHLRAGIFQLRARITIWAADSLLTIRCCPAWTARNSYLRPLGTEGIDFHQTNTPVLNNIALEISRQPPVPGPTHCGRHISMPEMTDPGVVDYMLRDNVDTEWLNYTRTFPGAHITFMPAWRIRGRFLQSSRWMKSLREAPRPRRRLRRSVFSAKRRPAARRNTPLLR